MSTERGLRLDDVVIGPWGRVLLPPTTAFAPPGTTLGVLGDAGSGKTTVLETIAGRRRPQRGTVRLDGAPPAPRTVGYAEQEHALPDGLTAAEHLAVPLLAHGTRPGDWSEVEALLDALGLPAAAHHNLLEELSGGQQQRVALARALVGRPALVCLDDPVSELDATTSELVWSAIAAAARGGAVVVVATPHPDDAARFDRTLLLDVATD